MAETTMTMAEWVALDLRGRRERRELLKELAEYQAKHGPLIMAAFRPKAVTAPPMPPKPDMRPPAEMPDNPTLADIAKQLGVSLEQLQQATGGMSLEKLRLWLRPPGHADVRGVGRAPHGLGAISEVETQKPPVVVDLSQYKLQSVARRPCIHTRLHGGRGQRDTCDHP